MSRDVYGKSSESVATIDLFALTYVVARVLTGEGSDFGLDTRGVLCSFSERTLFRFSRPVRIRDFQRRFTIHLPHCSEICRRVRSDVLEG